MFHVQKMSKNHNNPLLSMSGLILGLHPAKERQRYFVTMFRIHIGWAQA